jgi:hypothetical protein
VQDWSISIPIRSKIWNRILQSVKQQVVDLALNIQIASQANCLAVYR